MTYVCKIVVDGKTVAVCPTWQYAEWMVKEMGYKEARIEWI